MFYSYAVALRWKIRAYGKQGLENVTGNNTVRKLHYSFNKETETVD